MRRTDVASIAFVTLALGLGSLADAQRPGPPRGAAPPSRGLAPTDADIAYAPA